MLHLIMVISALVMTAVRVFGEYIQKALQVTGSYSVTLIEDCNELAKVVQAGKIQVAVLDAALLTQPVVQVEKLRSLDPGLVIILFNAQKSTGHQVWQELPRFKSFDGVLRMPDLLETLEMFDLDLRDRKSPIVEKKGMKISFPSQFIETRSSMRSRPAPEWMGDVNGVAQILTRLTLESAAHAALITRDGTLWAYAGHLSQAAAEELAQTVWHYWGRDGGSDLARFIRLEADQGEYMLYATGLGGEYVLGLAFEAAIPFSEMRMQAGILAKKLTTPANQYDVTEDHFSLSVLPDDEPPKEPLAKPVSSHGQQQETRSIAPTADLDPRNNEENLPSDRQAFFDHLLSEVEIPDPDAGYPPHSFSTANRGEIFEESGEGDVLDMSLEYPLNGHSADLQGKETVKTDKRELSSQGSFIHDQHCSGTAELFYACALVPRLPHHDLVGDLVILLRRWVTNHAIVFGWRLEHLEIRPDLIHWTAVLSPDLAPGLMVKNLRVYSSKEVFSEFPRLEHENPSGDFWAPGCLIVNGRKTLPQAILNSYLEKTRSWQGIQSNQPDETGK